MYDDLTSAVEADFPRARVSLESLIRIPSVSAAGFDPAHVRASAEATAALLTEAGAKDVQLLELGDAHPAVYGIVPGPDTAPTVLLYAHHDVQPPGPPEEWDTPPFEPVEIDGRLHGRGSEDDKAGVALHAAVIRAFGTTPPVTIKLFIEGEEEIGSSHLPAFLEAHADDLAADVIVIADSANFDVGKPALTTSLRGLVDCIVEVRTLEWAVHSGGFGGVAPDALTVLSRIIATLHDEQGNVAIEGLLSEDSPLERTEAEFRELSGVLEGVELMGSGSIPGRLWNKPAIAVLAIDAPPVGHAINQLVPVARAKISLRIAPGDDPLAAMDKLVSHIDHAPAWGAEVAVTPGGTGDAFSLDATGPAYDAFRIGMEAAYGTPAVEAGQGGSIPFVAAFQERYPAASILLTGVADPGGRAHGPNESLSLADFKSGILAEAIALQILGG